jgi:DNA-binding response OmpR family regulator
MPKVTAARQRPAAGQPEMKILVIDDNAGVRHTLSKLLAKRGHDVVTAADGDRGIMLFRAEHPRVVIADIVMPQQEGIETIIQIKRERPEVKVIAISGGGRESKDSLLHTAQLFGADTILEKPFDPQELLAFLESAEPAMFGNGRAK